MDYNELVQNLKEQLQHYGPKVPYGELVGAEPPYNRAGDLVWPDPEPYYIEQAINAITELLARVEEVEARANRLDEELEAHSESDLAKAHEALSADWAKQKKRAEAAEARAEKAEKQLDSLLEEEETAPFDPFHVIKEA